MSTRRRVLFVAEAVSLAHVARPVVLASGLAAHHEVSVASAPAFDLCFRGTDLRRLGLESIPAKLFLDRLAAGAPLYTRTELERYVEADIALLQRERPDVVIGDFRLSLSVSARLVGIPYFALCNAHWSPWSAHSRFPLPDITLTRVLGPALAEPIFRLAQPLAFRLHAGPLNAVRRKHGLSGFPDVRHAYTDGDLTLYADTPGLVPVRPDCPPNHHFIGPIIWSPSMPLPDWWTSMPSGPLAYVTLGSTGRVDLLPEVFRGRCAGQCDDGYGGALGRGFARTALFRCRLSARARSRCARRFRHLQWRKCDGLSGLVDRHAGRWPVFEHGSVPHHVACGRCRGGDFLARRQREL
jgi:UDP:flavonoid glycosyltransferase YjiC (YdhE family)